MYALSLLPKNQAVTLFYDLIILPLGIFVMPSIPLKYFSSLTEPLKAVCLH